tara:strand:- start:557 stop:1030 length:474 start_codon:yes stop_codon:yes gene_type:complete
MKKLNLILICGLIPFISNSQTYNELMGIVNETDFKRVMIENDFQFDSNTDGVISYGLDMEKDEDGLTRSLVWGGYGTESLIWQLQFADRKISLYRFSEYSNITDNIKEKCIYVNIVDVKEIDFVVYKCDESKFEGNIGFVIYKNVGVIRYFPNSISD